jgi:hypothetical protein
VSIASKHEFQRQLDHSVRVWAEGRLVADEDGEDIPLGNAYTSYFGWCDYMGCAAVTWEDFPETLSRVGFPACMVWEDETGQTPGMGIIMGVRWK